MYIGKANTPNVSSSIREFWPSLNFKLPRLHHSIPYYCETHDHVRIHWFAIRLPTFFPFFSTYLVVICAAHCACPNVVFKIQMEYDCSNGLMIHSKLRGCICSLLYVVCASNKVLDHLCTQTENVDTRTIFFAVLHFQVSNTVCECLMKQPIKIVYIFIHIW